MREITLKLARQVVKDFEPVGVLLRREGKKDREIIKTFNAHIDSKVKNYYNDKKNQFGIGATLKKSIEELKKYNYDSKAEVVFEYILKENKIPFKFQYKIKPYRVDFLVDEFLVVEIDGPLHETKQQNNHDLIRDKYLRDLGYKVLRLPIWLISASTKAVIDEIKEIILKNGRR